MYVIKDIREISQSINTQGELLLKKVKYTKELNELSLIGNELRHVVSVF